METLKERDAKLEKMWAELEDVPMNPETEKTEAAFLHFPAGTDKEDIWHWFDERHSKGVYFLLHRQEETSLHKFLKEEIPFRAKDILDIEDVSESVLSDIVEEIYDNPDCMFDYDRFDIRIEELLNDMGIFRGDN